MNFMYSSPVSRENYKPIIQKTLGSKEIKMIYTVEGESSTKNVPVSAHDRADFILSDEEIILLAQWGVKIEEHYSKKAGVYMPMDIEWAKDGITNQLFILQARPETVKSQREMNVLETYVLKEKGKVLVQGKSVGEKIGAGPINVISSAREIERFKKGEILVTQMTDPDWEPIMKIASGIVTDRGGRTCHAAIISRELGRSLCGGDRGWKRDPERLSECHGLLCRGGDRIGLRGDSRFRGEAVRHGTSGEASHQDHDECGESG